MPVVAVPDGPVHVPEALGAPPKELNKSTAVLFEHKVTEPLVPASGVALTTTSTLALAFEQGAMPLTEYVYVPVGSVAGMSVPLCGPLGPLQLPPDMGLPPNDARSDALALDEQRANAPLVPAVGC